MKIRTFHLQTEANMHAIQRSRTLPRRFRIGIDCHRTIIDIASEIKRLAKERFGIELPLEATRGTTINGRIHPDTFRIIRDEVVTQKTRLAKKVPEIPGAIEAIKTLQGEGHSVEIVTASGHAAHLAILNWLMKHKLDIPTRSVGRHALKGFVAGGYDIFLDDTVEQLQACLDNGTPFVYLLDSPTNRHISIPDRTHIIRVHDFQEFLENVRRKSNGSSYPPPLPPPSSP